MRSSAAAQRLFATRPRSGALVDVALATGALAVAIALLSRHGVGAGGHDPGQIDPASAVVTVCATAPLLVWRRDPRAVFAATASASVLLGGLGYEIDLPVGATVALYLLAASRDDAAPWTRRDSGLAIAMLAAFLGATAFGRAAFPGSELLHTGLAWTAAWFAGERTRLLHEHVAELAERALRSDREADRERRLAVAEERARIARDLHDSAGHAVNVIAVRAGAARLRHDEDPDRSRAALEAIEQVARETAREIDEIVGTLRDRGGDGEAVPTPPGLASLQTLVAHHSAAGLDVTVTTAGPPRRLGASIDVTAYRILQEALTNAARHGSGAAQVDVAFGEAELALTVTNRLATGPPARSNGGHGLIGMRERAAMLGGRLETDRGDGRFLLRARLPYEGRRT